ncbi:hypothetical protein BU17DRAFT_101790 [Hysterangium stoloniferum]|nr:hypothetical protein BU17DRAFT_101790 [Hysterangium stoloniferum]
MARDGLDDAGVSAVGPSVFLVELREVQGGRSNEEVALSRSLVYTISFFKTFLAFGSAKYKRGSLLLTLKTPLSPQVFDAAVLWAMKADKNIFWKAQSSKGKTSGTTRTDAHRAEEDKANISKLQKLGMTSTDEIKLLAVRDYIIKLSNVLSRFTTRSNEPEPEAMAQTTSGVELQKLRVVPQTIFIATRPSGVSTKGGSSRIVQQSMPTSPSISRTGIGVVEDDAVLSATKYTPTKRVFRCKEALIDHRLSHYAPVHGIAVAESERKKEAEAAKGIDGTGQVRSDGGVLVKQQYIPLPTLPQRYIIGNNTAHSGLFPIFINGIIKILNANIAPTQEDGPEFSDSNHPATPKKVLVDISIQTDHPTSAPSPSALGKRPIANILDFMERAVPEQSQPPSDKDLHVMAFGTSETLPEMPPAVPCIHDVPCEVDSSFASTDATLVNIEEMDDQTVGEGSKSVPVGITEHERPTTGDDKEKDKSFHGDLPSPWTPQYLDEDELDGILRYTGRTVYRVVALPPIFTWGEGSTWDDHAAIATEIFNILVVWAGLRSTSGSISRLPEVDLKPAHTEEKVIVIEDVVPAANVFINCSVNCVGSNLTSEVNLPASKETEEQREVDIPQNVVLERAEGVDMLKNNYAPVPAKEGSMTDSFVGAAVASTVSASPTVGHTNIGPEFGGDDGSVALRTLPGAMNEFMDIIGRNVVAQNPPSEPSLSVVEQTEEKQSRGMPPESYDPMLEYTAAVQNMWAMVNISMNRSGDSVGPGLPAGRDTEDQQGAEISPSAVLRPAETEEIPEEGEKAEEQSGVDEPVSEQAAAEPATSDGKKKKKKKKKKKAAVSDGGPAMDIPDNGEPHPLAQAVVAPPPSPPPLAPERSRDETSPIQTQGKILPLPMRRKVG